MVLDVSCQIIFLEEIKDMLKQIEVDIYKDAMEEYATEFYKKQYTTISHICPLYCRLRLPLDMAMDIFTIFVDKFMEPLASQEIIKKIIESERNRMRDNIGEIVRLGVEWRQGKTSMKDIDDILKKRLDEAEKRVY